MGAHKIPRMSASLPGTVFELIKVEDGSAGKRPTVTFSVKDKAGKPINPADMTRLSLVLAGPTSDYANSVSEDARKAEGSGGVYYWTFQQPIPADATGSFAVGIEGYRTINLMEGTMKQTSVRDAGVNKVTYFSVDGSPVQARRQVVAIEKCNGCHSSLSLHGDNRNRIEMCVLCHNPNGTDAARRPASEMPAQTIDFRTMVHKIHTGEELGGSYAIFGFGGNKTEFNEVLYPGDRRNCSTCHVDGSEQLPMRENLLPVNDPRGRIKSVQPTTAACTACHTSVQAASHALVNTSVLGESCAACHGPNAEFSVSRVHAR
jgi:OmcA/MtrC family decaheme c-type cytochrome